MIKKLLTSLIVSVFLISNSFAAGSGDSGSSKTKTQYDMAVTHIKTAKNFEKKNKPEKAKKHVLKMVQTQSLNCHSGKQIPCEIDSVCIHGDNMSSLETARSIRKNLIDNGLILKTLNKMKKFI